jgi:hypothetical protein
MAQKFTVFQCWRGNPRAERPYRVVEADSAAEAEAACTDHRGYPPMGEAWFAEARPYRQGDELIVEVRTEGAC